MWRRMLAGQSLSRIPLAAHFAALRAALRENLVSLWLQLRNMGQQWRIYDFCHDYTLASSSRLACASDVNGEAGDSFLRFTSGKLN